MVAGKSKIIIVVSLIGIGILLFMFTKLKSSSLNTLERTDKLSVPQESPDKSAIQKDILGRSIWKPPISRVAVNDLDQTDQTLVQHISEQWILPPFDRASTVGKVNKDYSQNGKTSTFIDKALNGRRNGFYIEVGALNGKTFSNTLFQEKSRNWTGLLIEANHEYFRELLQNKRHGYMINCCLSPIRKPQLLSFRTAGAIGGLVSYMEPGHKRRVNHEFPNSNSTMVQCFPLMAILKALNIHHVDYFSLDIEGAEFDILKTLDFGEVIVDVFTIEYAVSGERELTKEKLDNITGLLAAHDYKVIQNGGQDVTLKRQ